VETDEGVGKALSRFECVEEVYDGLGGNVIAWTKAHGGTSDDPSAQIFVLGRDGAFVARASDATAHDPKALATWLCDQSKAYERAHPKTALPLVRAEVAIEGQGEDEKAVCAALDDAKRRGAPALLYFGRDAAPEGAKKLQREVEASQKLERGALDAKSAAQSAKGWVLLRFDLADPTHARLAKSFGVGAAPDVVLVVPGGDAPIDLGVPSAATLRYRLKKHAP